MRRDDVEEIRRSLTDPRDVCARLGLEAKAKPQGGGLMILCVWHAERSASCSVTRGADGTIRVKCFGCGRTGDVFSLVAAVHDLDEQRAFPEVRKRTAQLAGLEEGGGLPPPRPRPAAPPPVAGPAISDDDFDRLAGALLEMCPLDERRTPDACAYLGGRRLLEEARRDRWGALPAAEAEQGRVLAELARAFGPEALAAADLVPSLGNHRRFKFGANRIVIPYRAPGVQGLITTLQRRRIDDEKPKYVFPQGRPARWPYGAEAIEEMGPETWVMFVEGATDTLDRRAQVRTAGVDRIVLGVPGVKNWRREWAQIAAERTALVGVDTDAAGEGAVGVLVADLWQAGARAVSRARPDDGRKDWNG